jgi:hypothetical protein
MSTYTIKNDTGPKHVWDGKFRHPHRTIERLCGWRHFPSHTCFGPASRLAFLKHCIGELRKYPSHMWPCSLRGQSHEKVDDLRVWGVGLRTAMGFEIFLIGPLTLKFPFCLIKVDLILNDAARSRILICLCWSAGIGPIAKALQCNKH